MEEQSPPDPPRGRRSQAGSTPRPRPGRTESPFTPPSTPAEASTPPPRKRGAARTARPAPPVLFQPPSADEERRPPSRTSEAAQDKREDKPADPEAADQVPGLATRIEPRPAIDPAPTPRERSAPREVVTPDESGGPTRASRPGKVAGPRKKATSAEKRTSPSAVVGKSVPTPADTSETPAGTAELASTRESETPTELAVEKTTASGTTTGAPTGAKKATAQKVTARKATARKATAKKTAAKKAVVTDVTAKKTAARKAAGRGIGSAEEVDAEARTSITAPGSNAALTPVAPAAAPAAPAAAAVPGIVPPRIAVRILDHPGYAPELLALAAVRVLGPEADSWARRTRADYPTATAHGLARLATRRFVRLAAAGGAAGAVAGTFAPFVAFTTLAWAQARLVLHLAASYGADPTSVDRAVDLLVLARVHPDEASARDALRAAQNAPEEVEPPLYRAAEAGWRLAAPLALRAPAWLALRYAARRIPGILLLSATAAASADTERLAARAAAHYRARPPAGRPAD